MALLPYQQIGDNLYVDQAGKQFNINKGYRSYVQSPFDTQAQKMDAIYNAQKKAQLDALKQQQTKAVNDLTTQKKNIAPVYQGQRNQADVVNAQNVSKLRELMAANGINASGENVTAQSNLASARQTSLNDINNNENQAIAALDKQIADVNDPSKQQDIVNQIEAARAQAQLDAWMNYMSQMDNKATDWRDYMERQKEAAAAAARSQRSGGGSSSSTSKAAESDLQKQVDEYTRQKAIEQMFSPKPFNPNGSVYTDSNGQQHSYRGWMPVI